MDSKFIITRERRALRPGDLFAWSPRSLFIRRFDSSDGLTIYYTDIRYYNRDVNFRVSSSGLVRPFVYIVKPRYL